MPYALPKLDMIAIPDFAAGAMENYGLVTYRESALLYDEKNSAAAYKQRVVICELNCSTTLSYLLCHFLFMLLLLIDILFY